MTLLNRMTVLTSLLAPLFFSSILFAAEKTQGPTAQEIAQWEAAKKQWESEFAEKEKALRAEQEKVGEVQGHLSDEIKKFERDREAWLKEQDAEVAKQVDLLFEEKQKQFEKEKKDFGKMRDKAVPKVSENDPAFQKELNKERAKFEEQRTGWRATIKNLTEQNAVKEAKIAVLEGRLSEADLKVRNHEKSLSSVSETEKKKLESERTLEELKKDHGRLVAELDGLKQKHSDLMTKMEILNRHKSEWETEKTTLLRQLEESRLKARPSEDSETLQEKERLNQARMAYEKWVEEQDKVIQKEKEELRIQKEALETDKKVLREKEGDFDKRLMEFRVKSDTAGMDQEAFQKKLLDERADKDRVKAELKKADQDRAELIKELLAQKNTNSKLEGELQKKALLEPAQKDKPAPSQTEKKAEEQAGLSQQEFDQKREIMKKLVEQKLALLEAERVSLEKERAAFLKEKEAAEAHKNAKPVQDETVIPTKAPQNPLIPQKNM